MNGCTRQCSDFELHLVPPFEEMPSTGGRHRGAKQLKRHSDVYGPVPWGNFLPWQQAAFRRVCTV